jgi:probable rRNA maturation factor
VSADAAWRQIGTPGGRKDRAFAEELTLYLVHGWLHLAGFDDLTPSKKRVMRRAEARAMKLLRDQRCLPTFQFEVGRARPSALMSPNN